jgi:hypothetical protein
MNVSNMHNQGVVSYSEGVFLIEGADEGLGALSKVVFLFLSLIATFCVLFSTKFFLDKFAVRIMEPEVLLDTNKELVCVFYFLRQNAKKIQELESLTCDEREGAVKEVIVDFFQTFGPLGKKTQVLLNSTLSECRFKEFFESCTPIGIRKPEVVITYMFTCLAKDFMQKVINNANFGAEDQEETYVRAIELAINAIEREVALLHYLFTIDKTRIQHCRR